MQKESSWWRIWPYRVLEKKWSVCCLVGTRTLQDWQNTKAVCWSNKGLDVLNVKMKYKTNTFQMPKQHEKACKWSSNFSLAFLISCVFGDTQNKTRRNKERVKWESTDWGKSRQWDRERQDKRLRLAKKRKRKGWSPAKRKRRRTWGSSWKGGSGGGLPGKRVTFNSDQSRERPRSASPSPRSSVTSCWYEPEEYLHCVSPPSSCETWDRAETKT